MAISPARLTALALSWATLWSGAFVAMKTAADWAGPYTIVGIRTTVAGAPPSESDGGAPAEKRERKITPR